MTLTRHDVVRAALELADARGADAVSLRALAGALGVQAMSLYTHVSSKADLFDALGDSILDEVLTELASLRPQAASEWSEWMLVAARTLRTVLLRHTDGARLVAGARASLRRADFSELAITALIEGGVARSAARLTVLAVERFTVGYVLEEQSRPIGGDTPLLDRDGLVTRLPNLTAAIVDYFSSGRTADDLFDDEIRLILRA